MAISGAKPTLTEALRTPAERTFRGPSLLLELRAFDDGRRGARLAVREDEELLDLRERVLSVV